MAVQPPQLPIDLHMDRLSQVCEQYGVVQLALFGSVLRRDFTDASDIDVLCTLGAESSTRGLRWIDLLLDLEALWERPVDLIKPHLLDARLPIEF